MDNISDILVSKEDIKELGHKEATMLTLLRKACNCQEYTLISMDYLQKWGFSRQTQQRILSDLEAIGKIDVKYRHNRYIKLIEGESE